MTEKKKQNASSSWKAYLNRAAVFLKKAWKFANEFDLIEKTKEIKIPKSVKIGGLALLLSSKSLDSQAANNPERTDDRKTHRTETTIKAAKAKEDKSATAEFSSAVRAYPGKYYNEICNGSPCWLASTYETNGAGIGKNKSSIATWNDKGGYRGINQISPANAKKFLSWLGEKQEYKTVYEALAKGGIGKANWQKTAQNQEHLMTKAFEWFMVEVYNPDNFKAIQDKINKSGINVSIKKLHPAILSAMHQLTVESPSRRTAIANKIIAFAENNGGDETKLNSEEFIKTLITNNVIKNRAVKLLNDTSITWNAAQFHSLLRFVQPQGKDQRSWFDIREEAAKKLRLAEKRKARLEKSATAAEDYSKQQFKKMLSDKKQLNSPKKLKLASSDPAQLPKKKKGGKTAKTDLLDFSQLKSRRNSGRS